jgi:hypothetical protein
MAMINGNEVDFVGIPYEDLGDLLLALSGTEDGSGLAINLTDDELEEFIATFETSDIGLVLAELVVDAVEKKTGKRPDLSYLTTNNPSDGVLPLTEN